MAFSPESTPSTETPTVIVEHLQDPDTVSPMAAAMEARIHGAMNINGPRNHVVKAPGRKDETYHYSNN